MILLLYLLTPEVVEDIEEIDLDLQFVRTLLPPAISSALITTFVALPL